MKRPSNLHRRKNIIENVEKFLYSHMAFSSTSSLFYYLSIRTFEKPSFDFFEPVSIQNRIDPRSPAYANHREGRVLERVDEWKKGG